MSIQSPQSFELSAFPSNPALPPLNGPAAATPSSVPQSTAPVVVRVSGPGVATLVAGAVWTLEGATTIAVAAVVVRFTPTAVDITFVPSSKGRFEIQIVRPSSPGVVWRGAAIEVT